MAVSTTANGWVHDEENDTWGIYLNGVEIVRVTAEGIEVLGSVKSKEVTPTDEVAQADNEAAAKADAEAKAAGGGDEVPQEEVTPVASNANADSDGKAADAKAKRDTSNEEPPARPRSRENEERSKAVRNEPNTAQREPEVRGSKK